MNFNNVAKYLAFYCCVSVLYLHAQDSNLSKLVEQEVKGAAIQNQSSLKKELNKEQNLHKDQKTESETLSNAPVEQKQESQVTESQSISVNGEENKKDSQVKSDTIEKQETASVIENQSVEQEIKNVVSNRDEQQAVPPKINESVENQTKENTGFIYNYDKVKTKEVTPYAGPCTRRTVYVYFEGDYIYWNAREEGLEYAADGFMQISNTNFYPVIAAGTYKLPQGKAFKPDFRTKSGFKAGAGLDFSYDGWNIVAVYTKLTSEARSEAASKKGLIPLQTANFVIHDTNVSFGSFTGSADAFLVMLEGSSDWHLNFSVLDTVLSREYFISSKLILKSNLGLKFTIQKQRYNVFYSHSGELDRFPVSGKSVLEVGKTTPTVVPSDKTEVLNIALAGESTSIRNSQHYWGFGPRVGSSLSWLFSKNFSLFGEGAVSTLWGRFKDVRLDNASVVDLNTGTVLVNNFTYADVLHTAHSLNAVLELQIGLRCDIWASKEDFRFRMQAGWENQVWFSQNHFSNLETTRLAAGNLLLQGLTAQLSIDF